MGQSRGPLLFGEVGGALIVVSIIGKRPWCLCAFGEHVGGQTVSVSWMFLVWIRFA